MPKHTLSSSWRSLAVVLAAGVLTSACAGFGGPINDDGELSPEERRLRSIESQIERNTRRIDNLGESQLSSQGNMAIADEMRALRGRLEELRHQLDRNQQRNQQRLNDIERRLAAMEGGGNLSMGGGGAATAGGSTVVAPGLGDSGASGSQSTAAPAEPDPAEEKAYLEAFELLKQGKYSDAILGFENVVQNWPNGRYADTALYWAGESHYVQRSYEKALQKFQALLEQHPNSRRTPDALLKAGFSYEELNRNDKAREMFQRIVNEYPDASAANLAKQRLERLS
ncbi:tol-pal system protein YbgF [Algiphilus sp.]|uniref:tol-pal system protein YbgF n=1 Tax=Algiphilus sp. TaxID=1872431 RepID=UPI002A60D036|nr:tol-pal system protein YbgF [Pseudomonadota bacterium]